MFARIRCILLAEFLVMALGGVPQAHAEPINVTVELLAADIILDAMPEDVVFDAEGRLYTGLEDGRILRFQADVTQPEVFAQIEGRPLGMRFDAEDNLVVCARNRLLSIDPGGSITELVSGEVDGIALNAINSVDIADDGTMYFSNSTVSWDRRHIVRWETHQ